MQPTHELTVQERPVISPRLRNVSRATITNAAYKIDGICYIIGGVDCLVCIVTPCHFIKDIMSGASELMLLFALKNSLMTWLSLGVVERHVPRLIFDTHSSKLLNRK